MISNTPEIQSSYISAQSIKKFVFPNGFQLLLYFLLSVLIVIFINAKTAWKDLSDSVLLPQNGLHDLVQPGGTVDMVWRNIANSQLPLIVFWALIGCLIYLFIWFVKSIVTNLQNDMIADLYQHPSTYSRSGFWANVIGHKVLFVTAVLVTIIYIYALFIFLPLVSHQAYRSIKYFESSLDILYVVIIIAGIMLLIHMFLLLIHMILNMWKIIYKDL